MQSPILSRRRFLKNSALAAGAAVALPAFMRASLFGQEPPSRRLNLALVGCGIRGGELLYPAARQSDVNILALCDPKPWEMEKKRKMCEETGHKPKLLRDYREVLELPGLDGVIIATQDQWHVPMAIAAARKGLHLYVEKPLCLSMDRMEPLRRAVAENRVVFQYGTMQRSDPLFRRTVELVRNGYLGKIREVVSSCPDFYNDEKAAMALPDEKDSPPMPADFDYDLWTGPSLMAPYSLRRTSRFAFHIHNYALGYVAGWGAHPIDIVQWGLNMDGSGPVRAEASGKVLDMGMFDTLGGWDAHARYATGVDYHFVSASLYAAQGMHMLDGGYQVMFKGDEGFVKVGRKGHIAYSSPALAKVRLKSGDWRCYPTEVDHMRNFLDCMKTGETTICPVEAAIRGDTVSHLVNLAARTGKNVEWDPKTEMTGDPRQYPLMVRTDFRPQWDVV